ncbi:MAG: hypothetical protein D6706_08280, partial [Chloroflexi bacterium]
MTRLLAILLGCLLVLSGCSGGGGSSSASVGNAVTSASATGRWSGTLTSHWSDGDFTDSFVVEFTQNGSNLTGTFTVGTESPVNLTGTMSGSDFTFSGVLSCAGNHTVQFGGTISGDTLTITSASGTSCNGATLLGASGTMTRASNTAMSNATLNGTYIMLQYIDDEVGLSQGGFSRTSRFEVRYDGAGNFNYQELSSSTGGALNSGSGTYSVAADGTLTTSMGDVGVVAADGNSFTTVDTDPSDNAVAIFVGVKKGAGLSNAVLNGTYTVGAIKDDAVNLTQGGHTVANRFKVTFDGSGNFSVNVIESSDGSSYSDSGTYSVEPDGTLTLNFSGYLRVGIVSVDGKTLAFADTDATDNEVGLYYGIKNGTGLSDATLNGTYVVNLFMDDRVGLVQGGDSITTRMEIYFDGSGNTTFTEISTSTGNIETGSGSYSITADGGLIINGKFNGIVNSDGNSFTFSDTDASDNDVAFFVGLKKPKEDSVAGIYALTFFGDNAGAGWEPMYREVVVSGQDVTIRYPYDPYDPSLIVGTGTFDGTNLSLTFPGSNAIATGAYDGYALDLNISTGSRALRMAG